MKGSHNTSNAQGVKLFSLHGRTTAEPTGTLVPIQQSGLPIADLVGRFALLSTGFLRSFSHRSILNSLLCLVDNAILSCYPRFRSRYDRCIGLPTFFEVAFLYSLFLLCFN